jgi:hypothetical protein
MPNPSVTMLQRLEGRTVNLWLADGTYMDGCQLISVGRGKVSTLWVFAGGVDAFVPRDRVLAVASEES